MKLALALLTCTFLSQAQIPAVSQAQTPAVTLQSLHDRQRVLLVFGNGDNQLAEEQLTIAATHADGFRERNLLLVGLSGSNAATPTAMLSAPDDAAARQRFHIQPGRFTVVLLGKDGGEKMRSGKPLSWETLQSTIDGMPMRKQEVRGKNQ